jgi:glycosyltransferase involved in cell wall biosynthesis
VVAAFVGTFGAWHGVEVLAQAIKQLAETNAAWLRKHKVHFLIVGDGLRMPQVREILSDASCQPFFTLTGLVPQAEAPTYIAAADLMLSPHVHNADGSRFFGSPTKLFEYMAMQKPIVAADLEQIGEVLRDSLRTESLPSTPLPPRDATALSVLMQPGDVPGLCRAIQFLVENPAWRATLGDNARREALTKYTWDRHVAAILDRLNGLEALIYRHRANGTTT